MADPAVAAAVADAHRSEWAYVLAATVRVTADLDLAEECVQTAFARALVSWARSGVPERPGRVADDDRAQRRDRRAPTGDGAAQAPPAAGRGGADADARLWDVGWRSRTTGCGSSSRAVTPRLPIESQVALTLRFVCGLSTADVARAFLVTSPRWPRGSRGPRGRSPGRASRTAPPGRRARVADLGRCSRSSTSSSRPGTPHRAATSSCARTSSSARSASLGCSGSCCRTIPASPGSSG